jgi:hypothetical protein
MKKHLVLLGIGLTLSLGGLVVLRSALARDAAKDEAPPRTATSKITHVTVYPDSALVTREVDVPAGEGTMELVVNPLPEHTINSSLYSEGSDGIRVMTTRFRTRPVKEDTREEVRKLEDELKKLEMTQQKLKADFDANKGNMGLLSNLEKFTAASTTNATEKGKLDSDATIALAKYLMEGRNEKTKEMVNLLQQEQTNQEQIEFVKRKLKEATAGSSKTERDAVIVVDKSNAAVGKVRLNYLVDRAAWRPQYKFRAGKTLKDPVQVEYLAAIVQQTGEDWQGVNLVLSTAQPMLNASPPDLKMLAVKVVPHGSVNPTDIVRNIPNLDNNRFGKGQLPAQPQQGQPPGQGQLGQFGQLGQLGAIPNPMGNSIMDLNEAAQQLRKQAQKGQNDKQVAESNEIFNYAGALEQARDLVLAEDQSNKGKGLPRVPKNEGPSVTYHLNTKLSVPSRNDEQVLEITRIDMAPDYFYKAVPVLTPHVYRQANMVNKGKQVLLPGEATMYIGTDFVGRMNLPLVAVGEQFTVGFGTEPQLQVQRVMMDKSRTMQGGNQVLKYEYRILVNSFKPERVKLQLWDRLPAAENETMGISLIKTAPELCKDPLYLREERTHNLLRWDLDIDPDMSGEKALAVNYEFKLELDKQMTIGSFQSK